ncbi:MAG: Por secretion system protein [Prevotella sp.]|nr:Por secretion system protein [Prevotella sp.]
MRTKKYTIRNLVKWFLPFYLFTFLPLFAQVGTWRNYLAYHQVQSICKAGDELFVLASNDLYQYNMNDQSITTYDKINGLSDTHITHIAWSQQAKRLIAVYQNANIDIVKTDGDITNIAALYNKSMTEDKTVDSISIEGIYAYLHCRFGIVKVNLQRAEISETYTPNMPDYPQGLTAYQDNYDEYINTVASLNPGGPAYNHFYEAKFLNGKLYTTGGYFLPSIPDNQLPGIIQTFDRNNWTLYEEGISEKTGYKYEDNCCIDVDPTNTNHVFVGGKCGLYEFLNNQLVAYYNKDNSPLKGANDRGTELGNDFVLILGIKFDAQGNLWVLNSMAKGVSLLKLSPNHEWTDLHQPLLTDEAGNTLAGLRDMIIDSRGLLWFVNNNWQDPSLFCYDMENDKLIKYNNFTNQDGVKYDVTWAYCVAEDRDGNIWVGTNSGPFLIQKQEIGQESVTFNQVKVPRNDGTNYADYLLSGVSISSIAIDGGNRKWFGSNGAGAFLISADNLGQIHNFTTDNSKLITNNISSIAINQKSGEVFFLSDDGLCSYMSNAIEPEEEMTKDNIWAYPNPVTPDYTGLITITGLSYDADVKIVASNGALIAEGRSSGGMFTWDGCDQKGRRVISGIYFVVSATSEGRSGTCCKIAVIR